MYKKYLIFFSLLLIVAIVCVGLMISRVTDRDRSTYQALLESSTRTQKGLINYSEHQRHGVSKEIWYQDVNPLYFRIDSDESELFLFHQENEVEVVEQLETVRCMMQEELYYEEGQPMQLVRYIEANEACYNYNTQLFIAKEATLWKYRLKGHEPIFDLKEYTPLMTGTAQSVEFIVKGKKLDFQAQNFKAKFNSKEELR